MSPKPVAIIVAFHKKRSEFDAVQLISYQRLWDLYGNGPIPIILAAPTWLDTTGYTDEHPGMRVERFDFRTYRDYNQLLLDPHFFERFQDYQYILIHDLDCYILRDELEEWCLKGYDFIGAPIFRDYEPAQPEGKLSHVGNGGLSLRNVRSALQVLGSRKRYLTPSQYWEQTPAQPGLFAKMQRFFNGLLRLTRIHNDIRWATLSNFHEDIFWSIDAAHFWPDFKVPNVETGLQFSFDYAPAYCYEQNGRRLPFGCHAWQRYDLPFWKTYIPEAADLPVPFKP